MNAVDSISGAAGQLAGVDQGIGSVDIQGFFDLLIAQLSNQDPLNPLENDEILAQVSQMRGIEASNQLADTLDQFLLIQQLTGASSLIGKVVEGTATDGSAVTGTVNSVLVEDGKAVLTVGEHIVPLENVTRMLAEQTPESGEQA